MKKIKITGLFLSLIILFTACEEALEGLRTINSIPFSKEFTIDYLPVNQFEEPTVSIQLNIISAIQDEIGVDADIDFVEDVKIKNLTISMISCENKDNFDFLNGIKLCMKTDELPEKEIAYKNEIPKGKTTIALDVMEDALDEYVKSDSLELFIKYESTEDAKRLKIKVDINFKAKLRL